jgi:hypothetical protein
MVKKFNVYHVVELAHIFLMLFLCAFLFGMLLHALA